MIITEDLLSRDGHASCVNGFVSSISQDSSSLFGSFFVQVFIVQYIGSLATVVEDMLQPKTLPPTTVIHELNSKIQRTNEVTSKPRSAPIPPPASFAMGPVYHTYMSDEC